MSTNNENDLMRSGGPTQKSFLSREGLPSVTTPQDVINKMTKEFYNEKKAKQKKHIIANKIKYAPMQKPEIVATIPVVSNERILYNADSADNGQPAKIIQRTELMTTTAPSKRTMKKDRAKLSKNNFQELPSIEQPKQPPMVQIKTEQSQIYDVLMAHRLKYVRCYYCDSSNVTYAPMVYNHWYSFACRSMACLESFKWHPIYERQSNLGCIAIINPISNTSLEEDLIKIAENQSRMAENNLIQFPEVPKELLIERKLQAPKRQIVFDESCIVLPKKANNLSDQAQLTFKQQKKIVNSGLRKVNTIPVTSTMSYRNALVDHQHVEEQSSNEDDYKMHKAEFYKVKTLFFAWNKILFAKWQRAKIDKKYKNKYLSNSKAYLNRFYQEPTKDMKAALDEWYVLAATFGQASGKITSNWSE